MPDPTPPSPSKQHIFQAPTGTRDLYPVEAARRRFIMDAWRKVSINHGFEEIDGPTFEHLDLYTVKSGEGIVSELFSFERAGGEKTYALRPEFTPTLARMYAAKAASLPKPTKWFTAGPFFRAERPQRGRLREFLQWNCDVMGLALPENPDPSSILLAKAQAELEAIACCVSLLTSLGLGQSDFSIHINDRNLIVSLLRLLNVPPKNIVGAMAFLDRRSKLSEDELNNQQLILSLPLSAFDNAAVQVQDCLVEEDVPALLGQGNYGQVEFDYMGIRHLWRGLRSYGIEQYCRPDLSVARGLAYYTGTVFEVIVDNERAVAGGGRYDNLIEMFGGPPTPAVGFGMGDVVLSLVLQDKGLMPSDAELMGIAGQWPDAFVISNGTPEADAAVPAVLAALRRGMSAQEREERKLGSESRPTGRPTSAPDYGLHARRSYKSTKNIGKLLQDAVKCNARFAVIVESATEATIKDMRTSVQDQHKTPIADLAIELRKRLA